MNDFVSSRFAELDGPGIKKYKVEIEAELYESPQRWRSISCMWKWKIISSNSSEPVILFFLDGKIDSLLWNVVYVLLE